MKAAIRLVVRFILWFTLVALIASALVVAHRYVTGYDPSRASSVPFVPHLLDALSLVWFPAVLAAAVLALFSAARAMEGPFVAVLAVFALWTLLLFAGGLLQSGVPSDGASDPPVVPERRLVRSHEYRLFPLERDGLLLSPLLTHDANRSPGFSIAPAAQIDPENERLVIPGRADDPVDLSALANSYPAMVRTPGLVQPLLDDIRETARLLALGTDARGPVLLNLLALSVYLLGSWTLVRLTRWPLFNATLALGALRLALWLVPAVQAGTLRSLFIAAFSSNALPFVSAALLGGIGLGFVALLVFLPPLTEWKREVEHG